MSLPPNAGAVAELLEAYVAGAERNPVRHGSSHLHRNGFSKIGLLRGAGTVPWNLRMHIWWGRARGRSDPRSTLGLSVTRADGPAAGRQLRPLRPTVGLLGTRVTEVDDPAGDERALRQGVR